MADGLGLLQVFRFRVEFFDATVGDAASAGATVLWAGSFSEVSGLEATMEPYTVKEGGWNYGERQRVGRTNFATFIAKRGMTASRNMWNWFNVVASGGYAFRMNAIVSMMGEGDADGNATGDVHRWELVNVLPTKFKAADMNAKQSEIAIEELHLAHEGMHLVSGAGGAS